MNDCASQTFVPSLPSGACPELERLEVALGFEWVSLLADLVLRAKAETGYGGIEIVVAGGRVQSIKITNSYRVNSNTSPPVSGV